MKHALALTPRQLRFANLYLSGIPAGRAYEQAGYVARDASADAHASRTLKLPGVAAYLAEERERMQDQSEMSRDELIAFLVSVIRTPVGQLDENSPLVQHFSIEESAEGCRKTVKMCGKLDAADKIAKLMNWYSPAKVEVSLTDQIADIISRVRGES